MTIERPPWRYRTPAQREKRDARIMELWEMGYSRQEIAEKVDLTTARISQIVANFGGGFR